MRILVAVITYYPEKEILKRNLEALRSNLGVGFHLLIWENTPSPDHLHYRPESLPTNKCTYLGTGKNEFIAYPLNRIVKYATENGFTHLLTMDQDSLLESNAVSCLISALENHPDAFAAGPRIRSVFLDTIAPPEGQLPPEEKTPVLITSGCLYNLKLFKGIFAPESYKIDYVDYHLCLQAKAKGLSCIRVNKAIIHQHFGNTCLKNGKVVANYSPLRCYFQTRNRIWIEREYTECHSIFPEKYYNTLTRAATIILYEKNRIAKIGAILKGVWDGWFKNIHTT